MPGYTNYRSPTFRTRMFVFIGLLVTYLIAVMGYVNGSFFGENAKVARIEVEETSFKTSEILVPIRDINAGEAIRPELFRKEMRPQIGLSDKTVQSFDDILSTYARTKIPARQAFNLDMISNSRPATLMSARIPNGYRAVSIPVTATSSVEGWAQPGSEVDILWTTSATGETALRRIVERAVVLSAERRMQAGNPVEAPTTVTLLVSKYDAQKIQLARSAGTISLTLRGVDELEGDNSKSKVTLNDLRGKSDAGTNSGTFTIAGETFSLDTLREGSSLVAPEPVQEEETLEFP